MGNPLPATVHPFHVSVTEIEHNEKEKTLQISCKIFTDDFETILARNYKTKVDLVNPANRAAMDTLVKKYLLSHLSVRMNNKPVHFSYLGFEHEKEAVYGYVEAENVITAGKIEIISTILYDMFDDQVNIFHVKAGGGRKSSKLNYPDKELKIEF
ncbi:MAG: hypothetical protein IPM85_15245 [Chitinophagaceae bacterium]|nr:hypothetical protein [Chitinophagaceae bacterium]